MIRQQDEKLLFKYSIYRVLLRMDNRHLISDLLTVCEFDDGGMILRQMTMIPYIEYAGTRKFNLPDILCL